MMKKKQSPSKPDYDVIIVGGGMVGASLAIALKPLRLKVCVIDAFAYNGSNQPSYDDRSIALSYGSSLIFKGMGLWDELKNNTTPINQIHVSDRGHFGAARLTAAQENVEALGYLVESRVFGQQLYKALEASDIELMTPAKVIGLQQQDDASITVELTRTNPKESNQEILNISARLVVAADGTESPVRQLSGISVSRVDYQQSAIIANVSTQKMHKGQAFERFTEHGPIALLPLTDNRSSLVWTHSTKNSSDSCNATMAMDDKTFLNALDEVFGYRLGKFTKVGKRSLYPLSLVTSDKNTAYRTVVIGNASHTLHPVAGQGLNLALRDVAVLADLLSELYIDSSHNVNPNNRKTIDNGKLTGITDVLNAYETLREGDLDNTVKYTDSLVRLFSNNHALLGHARAGGLLAVDRITPMRKWLTRQSMGIHYRQARLARGLALRVSQ